MQFFALSMSMSLDSNGEYIIVSYQCYWRYVLRVHFFADITHCNIMHIWFSCYIQKHCPVIQHFPSTTYQDCDIEHAKLSITSTFISFRPRAAFAGATISWWRHLSVLNYIHTAFRIRLCSLWSWNHLHGNSLTLHLLLGEASLHLTPLLSELLHDARFGDISFGRWWRWLFR